MANLTKIAAGLLIAAAVVLGLFAWMLAHRPPPRAAVVQSAPVTRGAWLTPVVVARRTLPAGLPITVDALRLQSLPVHLADAFSNPMLIAGRVPRADIPADSPVLDSQLSSSLATRIEPGQRAVAVSVDEVNSVDYQIRPGNYVDVFFTLHRDGGTGAEVGRTQTRLLLSKARVLMLGGTDNPAARPANSATTNHYGAQNAAPHTAVLAVPVEEVDTLTLAQSQGHLTLALRNPADDDTLDASQLTPATGVIRVAAHDASQPSARAAEGVALDQLAGNSTARPPGTPIAHRAAPRKPGNDLEVIRGGRVQTVAW